VRWRAFWRFERFADVVTALRRIHAAWDVRWCATIEMDGQVVGYACALVACPRGRDHARACAERALGALARVVLLLVNGQKTTGSSRY